MEAENFLSNNDLKVYVNGQPLEDFGFIKIVFVDESEEKNHGKDIY